MLTFWPLTCASYHIVCCPFFDSMVTVVPRETRSTAKRQIPLVNGQKREKSHESSAKRNNFYDNTVSELAHALLKAALAPGSVAEARACSTPRIKRSTSSSRPYLEAKKSSLETLTLGTSAPFVISAQTRGAGANCKEQTNYDSNEKGGTPAMRKPTEAVQHRS